MPAIDFPASPSVNDEYSFEGRTWLWNGTGWEVKSYPAALQLGSASAPSLYFTGDPNTGLYSPGADQVAISTGGTGRLFVDASGNVKSTGDLYANGTNGLVLYDADPTNYNIGRSGGDLTFKGGGSISVQAGGGSSTNAEIIFSNSPYLLFKTAGTERLRITSDGKVGIGTSSPGNLLTVTGAAVNVAIAYFNGTDAADSNGILVKAGGTNAGKYIGTFQDAAGNTRLHILADGKVGIGTSSPAANTHIVGVTGTLLIKAAAADTNGNADVEIFSTGTTGNSRLYFADTAAQSGSIIYSHAENSLALATAGAERARIDSSGRLLVGTSTARTNFYNSTNATRLQTEGTNFEGSSGAFVRNSNNASSPGLILAKSRGTSLGSNTIVQDGDFCGEIAFQGNDGSEFVVAASIAGAIDGTPAANDMPGRLVFSTTADGAASPTERMRIDSAGNVGIGTSTPSAKFTTEGISGTYPTTEIRHSVLETEGEILRIGRTDSTLRYHSITAQQSATAGGADNYLAFKIHNTVTSTAQTEVLRLTGNGYVRLAAGTGGIQFGGDTAAANALDDYEEGTFTPTIVGTGTAGAGTYSVQVGRYTKIGQRVYFQINLTWSAHTGTTNMIVGALPFTSANVQAVSAVSIRHSNLTSPASTVVQGYVTQNATTITLESIAVAGGAAAALALDTAATLTVAGDYEAA